MNFRREATLAYLLSCGTLVALCLPLACGGSVDDDFFSGSGGDASQSTGGTNETTGGTSFGASGGHSQSGSGGVEASGGAGAEPGCCLAAPICDPGDEQMPIDAECPGDAVCYVRSICCSTIKCMASDAPIHCDAIPTCDADERQVTACTSEVPCVERSLCGSKVFCEKLDPSACNPEQEPDRYYVGTAGECLLIDFSCEEGTTYFGNDCGCGCEQPAECPDLIDCATDREPDALCDADACPYTERSF